MVVPLFGVKMKEIEGRDWERLKRKRKNGNNIWVPHVRGSVNLFVFFVYCSFFRFLWDMAKMLRLKVSFDREHRLT